MRTLDLAPYKQHYEYEYDGNLKNAIHRVGGNGDFEIEKQPDFMKGRGLKPYHRFLDLGCGCLRGTAKLVDYLDEGNFFGADVSQGLIDAAYDHLRSLRIQKSPTMIRVDDFNFDYLIKEREIEFDYILSVSLFTHLLPDAIEPLFVSVRKMLSPTGSYYFTIIPLPDGSAFDHAGTVEISQYNKKFLGRLAQKNGLLLEDSLGDYPNEAPDNKVMRRVNFPGMGQWVLKATRA